MASVDEVLVLSFLLPEYRLRRVGILRHYPVAQGSEQTVGTPRRERTAAHPREKRGESHLPLCISAGSGFISFRRAGRSFPGPPRSMAQAAFSLSGGSQPRQAAPDTGRARRLPGSFARPGSTRLPRVRERVRRTSAC